VGSLNLARARVFLAKWGSYGSGDGQFNHPSGVAVDGSGNVYVTDWDNNRVQKFSLYNPALPLTVNVSPPNATVFVGQWATFAANASGGTSPYTYQWYESGNLMIGQTGTQLAVSKINAPGIYTFYCKVTESSGQTANSNQVTLTVVPALTASAAPASLSATVGQSVTFIATASGGTTPYSYQWYENTTLLSGKTTSTFSTSKSSAGTITFYCKVTESSGQTANSNQVTLTVVPALTASAAQTSSTVTTGQQATFTVNASGGTPPYTYQWYEGATPITGQTQATLTTSKSTAGSYTFYSRVMDSAGRSADSSQVTLLVNSSSKIDYVFAVAALIGVAAPVLVFAFFWRRIKNKPKTEGESQISTTQPIIPETPSLTHIFISHVEEDASSALEIASGLEAAGYNTWIYERDSIPGPSYLIQTRRAIEQSQAVIIVISSHSLSSRQVTVEVIRAHEAGKYLIPVLLGISHIEFQARQPEWAEAIGSATSISIPTNGISAILPRIAAGLMDLGVKKKDYPQ